MVLVWLVQHTTAISLSSERVLSCHFFDSFVFEPPMRAQTENEEAEQVVLCCLFKNAFPSLCVDGVMVILFARSYEFDENHAHSVRVSSSVLYA